MSPAAAALALVGANLVWSASGAVAKVALAEVTPFELAWLRLTLASAVLVPLARRVAPGPIDRADRIRAAALGVVGFGLAYGMEYAGLDLARASNLPVLVALEPLGIVIAASLLLGERVGPRRAVAAATALAGVALVSVGEAPGQGPSTGKMAAGNFLLIGAIALNVGYTIGAKSLLERYPPIALTAYSVAAGALALTPVALAGFLAGGPFAPSARTSAAVAYLAFGSTVLGYLLWNSVLNRFDAAFLAVFLYVQPVAGVLFAWALVGEEPTPLFVAGAALILAAVWLGTRGEPKGRGG